MRPDRRPVLAAALFLNRRGERFLERHGEVKRVLRGAYHVVNREPSAEVLQPLARDRLASFYAAHVDGLAATLRSAGISGLPAWLSQSRA